MAAPEAAGHLPDHDLVAAVRDGDDRAFEQLYTRYHSRIAAYVRGMVKDHGRAEDVTQEVFFSALRRMRETERPIAFKPWVYEIARNACIDLFRRTSRAEELSYDQEGGLAGDDYSRLVSQGPTPDAAVDAKQQLDHLRGAFGGLSETHHQILVLRELEGLSYREIGERLGMSRPAVESTLFRARRRLTEEYDELVSGRRCQRVQGIIATAAEGMLGARDERRLARHLSYCQGCRREARLMGVEPAARPRTTVAAKVAALLPLPAFLRRGRSGGGGGEDGAASAIGAHSSNFAVQLSSMLPAAEPAVASWGKVAAALATLAVAGVGAGVVTHEVTGLAIPGLDRIPLIKDVAGGGSGGGGGHAGASGGAGGGGATGGGAASNAFGAGSAGGGGSAAAGGTGAAGGGARAAGDAGSTLNQTSGGGGTGSVTGATGSLTGGGGGSGSPNVGVPSVTSPSAPSTDTSSAPSTDTSSPSTTLPDSGKVTLPASGIPAPTLPSAPSTPDTSSADSTINSTGLGH